MPKKKSTTNEESNDKNHAFLKNFPFKSMEDFLKERKEKNVTIRVNRAFARQWLSKHGRIKNREASNFLLLLGLFPLILMIGFGVYVIVKGQYLYLFSILAFLLGYIVFQSSFKYGPSRNIYKLIGLILWVCLVYSLSDANYNLFVLAASLIVMRWSFSIADSLAVKTLIKESLRDEKFFCFLWEKDILSIETLSIKYSVNEVDTSRLVEVLESVSGKKLSQ